MTILVLTSLDDWTARSLEVFLELGPSVLLSLRGMARVGCGACSLLTLMFIRDPNHSRR